MIDTVRAVLAGDAAERHRLSKIEAALADLAAQPELFPEAEFPHPSESDDRNYLLHQDVEGTLALYLCIGKPGVAYGPHDHGGTWATIAALEGAEHHRLYRVAAIGLECVGEATCEPGNPVSIPTDGIHSIEPGPSHFAHLHLYGLGFEHQGIRRVFDPNTGEERRVRLDDFSWIEDRRPLRPTT